jgi:hypothetical protein
VSLPLSVTGVSAPAYLTFQLIQDNVGGHSFSWPSNVLGGCSPIFEAANGVMTQQFIWNGTNAIALGPCITNTGSLVGPTINGTQIVDSPGTYYVGSGTTAVVGDLVYLTTGSAGTILINPAGNQSGIIGIATSLPSASTVNVQQSGTAFCNFDGAATAPNYVQASSSVNGDCHDAGASYPSSGQVLGRILTNIGSAGVTGIDLFGPEIRGNGAFSYSGAALGPITQITTFSGNIGAGGSVTVTFTGSSIFHTHVFGCSAMDTQLPNPMQWLPGGLSSQNFGGTAFDTFSGFCIGN